MATAATIFDASKTPSLPHGAAHSMPMPVASSGSAQHPSAAMTPPFSPSFQGLPMQIPTGGGGTAPSGSHKATPRPISSSSPTAASQQPADSTGDGSEHYRRMTQTEWLHFCRAVGILKDGESGNGAGGSGGEEGAAVVMWPPRGFSDGLYADILFEKSKFTYWFHVTSTLRWILMLIQLALGAVLTALGATSSEKNGLPITIIAAINTSIAGVLALMHNSGLPDRYRSDRNEFYKLEEHIKAIADTKLVPINHNVNDVIAQCWQRFQTALQTVQNNVPASYVPASSGGDSGAGGAPVGGSGAKLAGKASTVLHKMARSAGGSEK
ncbi:hypothetical protein F5Y16DRAFT_424367 [Xylariaceae sp. FL0255]|nr:hypothetical protein F5Y16DRAFT_424367 [Xylariaceae sp. FL0255]